MTGTVRRYAIGRNFDDVSSQLADLRQQWRQVSKEQERLENELLRLEELSLELSSEAQDLMDTGAFSEEQIDDLVSAGLNPDDWE